MAAHLAGQRQLYEKILARTLNNINESFMCKRLAACKTFLGINTGKLSCQDLVITVYFGIARQAEGVEIESKQPKLA